MEAAKSGVIDATTECMMHSTPDAEQYAPSECDPLIKPVIGKWFPSFEDGIEFYRCYVAVVGFDVRRSSTKKDHTGDVVTKHVVCACEGFKQTSMDNAMPADDGEISSVTTKRRRASKRVGCGAKIAFKKQGNGGVVIFRFEEKHTHCLCSEASKPFLRANRKLDIVQQQFIVNCAKANIGPSSAFRLFKESVGGCANVGATRVDYCNFKRNTTAYVGSPDAQLVLDKFNTKQKISPDFYFNHDVDEFDNIIRIFWADLVARRNYACFGDAVSFDATYQTNRYKLVFVPFTGVDNHKKSVIFAAGLISKEDVESYKWLLENFMKAMKHEPSYVITDQDPAVIIAVEKVFKSARHRFCMWHIMSKVDDKVRIGHSNNEAFRHAFDKVVWDETCTPLEFESSWKNVMLEFGLTEHKWLCSMYDLRTFWIPAYFRDILMGGLLRTTSRSESQNSVFGKCISKHSNLVEFFIRFEGVIDTQRFEQAKLDAACEGKNPQLKTPLPIERYAATTYTVTVFYDIQQEIYEGCFGCRIVHSTSNDVLKRVVVEDSLGRTYTVDLNTSDQSVECSCNMFNRIGMLCRHTFVVYKDLRIETIPSRYTLSRWKMDAHKEPRIKIEDLQLNTVPSTDKGEPAVRQLLNDLHTFIGLAKGNTECIQQLAGIVKERKVALLNEGTPGERLTGRDSVIEAFCGTLPTAEITVHPPPVCNNKGSGKRLKSTRDIAVKKANKPKCMCKKCRQMGHHDSRNCPLP